jgi:hypothetical protein
MEPLYKALVYTTLRGRNCAKTSQLKCCFANRNRNYKREAHRSISLLNGRESRVCKWCFFCFVSSSSPSSQFVSFSLVFIRLTSSNHFPKFNKKRKIGRTGLLLVVLMTRSRCSAALWLGYSNELSARRWSYHHGHAISQHRQKKKKKTNRWNSGGLTFLFNGGKVTSHLHLNVANQSHWWHKGGRESSSLTNLS